MDRSTHVFELKILHLRLLLLFQYGILVIVFFLLRLSGTENSTIYIMPILLLFLLMSAFSGKITRFFYFNSSLLLHQNGIELTVHRKKEPKIFSVTWQQMKSISIFSDKKYFYLRLILNDRHKINVIVGEIEIVRNQKSIENMIDCLEHNVTEHNRRSEFDKQIAIVPFAETLNKKQTFFYKYGMPVLLFLLFYILFEVNLYFVLVFPVIFILLFLLFQKPHFLVSGKSLD